MNKPGIDPSVHRELRPLIAVLGRNARTLDADTDLAEFVSWFEETMASAGHPGTAWHLGQRCDYRSRGPLGHVVMNSGTLGAGLHWLCRFYPLIQDVTSLTLEIEGDTARLCYRILDPTIWPRHHDALYTLGVFSSLLRTAAPEVWPKVQIWLEAPRQEVQTDLSTYIHAPVICDAQTNAIVFPASALNRPLNRQDRVEQQHIKYLAECLTKKNRAMPVTERARYVILSDLYDSQVSQEHVASALGLSSRTLRRKLSGEGASYQELLDECRMQIAARAFQSASRVSLSQVALQLGYSEHSTFTRAFGRWSGMAPRDYRASHSGAEAMVA